MEQEMGRGYRVGFRNAFSSCTRPPPSLVSRPRRTSRNEQSAGSTGGQQTPQIFRQSSFFTIHQCDTYSHFIPHPGPRPAYLFVVFIMLHVFWGPLSFGGLSAPLRWRSRSPFTHPAAERASTISHPSSILRRKLSSGVRSVAVGRSVSRERRATKPKKSFNSGKRE